MKKSKTLLVSLLCLLIVSLVLFSSVSIVRMNASADTEQGVEIPEEGEPSEGDPDDGIMPLILTTLTLSLNGENGVITASVKNVVTIFPSTVYVVVQLYSSLTYCEDYTKMTLEDMNSTLDLDMGHTISCSASTGGVTKYWMARARYSEDAGNWKEKTLGPAKYSGAGENLGLT